MVADWYYAKDGERFGPFDAQQLKQLAADGTLSPTDAVARKGMSQWAQATTVKGLFPATLQPISGQTAAEVTLYRNEDVLVTSDRVIIGDALISVRDIASAHLDRKKGLILIGAAYCAIMAVALAFTGIENVVQAISSRQVFGALGLLLLTVLPCAGLSFATYKIIQADKRHRVWRLNIQTNDESIQALNSTDKATIIPVLDAINEALRMRSNR